MQALSWLETALSILATIIAGVSAYYAFCANRRSKKNEEALAADERIIHGKPDHPGLQNPAHDQSVIRCRLVNKSKHRRATVKNVRAFDRQNSLMDVTWCSTIDYLGVPQDPEQVIPIDESAELYIRDKHSESISYAKIEVHHSFPGSPTVITYDATQELFGDDVPD